MEDITKRSLAKFTFYLYSRQFLLSHLRKYVS